MSKLQRALAQTRPPGVYRFDSSASVEFLRDEAERAAWKFYFLDGKKISDKASFLEAIARAMNFPNYFGKNWDALNDSLTDLEGIAPKGYVLLFQSPERFMRTNPNEWEVAHEVFESAIEFWSKQKMPFYVLLRGANVPRVLETL